MTFHQYQLPLLKACDYLHNLTTGASETYTPIDSYLILEYLRRTLSVWDDDRPGWKEYNGHVKALIQQVVSDAENCGWIASESEALIYLERHPLSAKKEIRDILKCTSCTCCEFRCSCEYRKEN